MLLEVFAACNGEARPPVQPPEKAADPAPADAGERARVRNESDVPAQDESTAAAVLSAIFDAVEPHLRPGNSTEEIDDVVARETFARNATPYFLGYHGYPKHCTTSINEEVINTLPSSRRLKDGDLLKLQLGVRVGESHATQSWTYAIGRIQDGDATIIAAGLRALRAGVGAARAGARTGDVSAAIEAELTGAKMTPSRAFVGHGIGKAPHQDPAIPGFGRAGQGPRLKAGETLSIVVLGHAGAPDVHVLEDEWNAVARDGKKSVLFSQMVRVGETSTVLVPERDSAKQ